SPGLGDVYKRQAFCDTCGSRLEADHNPEAAPEAAAPVNQQQTSYTPNSTPSYQAQQGYQSNAGFQGAPGYQAGPAQQANTGYQGYNTGYHNPPPAYPVQPQNGNQMTTGKWLGIFLINIIPAIGPLIYLILLFKWAFGSCKYPSLKSFSKAMLIIMLIGIIIGVIVAIFVWPMIQELIDNGEFPDFFSTFSFEQ
ncbi:MAG: hypothetical protein N2376_11230, partial [Clostridia bacterium]|nr:hypothetical protein [Clostridia bacterium]